MSTLADHEAHCRTLMKDVAEILGLSLHYPDFDHGVYLAFEPETGGELFVHFNGQNKRRLSVGYSVPRRGTEWKSLRDLGLIRTYDEDPTRATLSADRTPKALAAEIKRRCLIPAREMHARVLAKYLETSGLEAARDTVAERLAAIFGLAPGKIRRGSESHEVTVFDVGAISYGTFRVHLGGSISIDRLSLASGREEAAIRALAEAA